MSTVEQIKAAIGKLSIEERAELERMLHGWTDDAWDEQIKSDAESGKLDYLPMDADAQTHAGLQSHGSKS